MHWARVLGLLFLVWGFAGAAEPEPLRVGVVQSLFRNVSKEASKTALKQFETYMKEQTGRGGAVLTVKDAFELADQLAQGKQQFGTFHGFEFAWARQKNPRLKPLVLAVNLQQHLRAYVLVRADGPLQDWAGLKGKSLAMPAGTKEHCRLFLERLCRRDGQDVDKYFNAIAKPDTIEDALDDVVDGLTPAALVDGVGLARFQQNKPARFAKLKVLEKSVVFPASVIAYQEGQVDADTLARVRKALLHASANPDGRQILLTWKMAAFEAVPQDYDHLVADIIKTYPPPPLSPR